MNASDGHPLIGDAFLAARPLRKEGPVKVMRTSGCAAQHLGMLFFNSPAVGGAYWHRLVRA